MHTLTYRVICMTYSEAGPVQLYNFPGPWRNFFTNFEKLRHANGDAKCLHKYTAYIIIFLLLNL